MKTLKLLTRYGFTLMSIVATFCGLNIKAQEYTFTTLAGVVGGRGSIDGPGSTARFNFPAGVAVDSSGNLFVSDGFPNGNQTIRKITLAGVVTTLAGLAGSHGANDGTGSSARFNSPTGVAVDSVGNVYVADTWNHTIRKVTSRGVVTTLAGRAGSPGFVNGTGSAARFNYPSPLAVDAQGNLYVADDNGAIRKVTPGGVVTTVASNLNFPKSLAVDTAGNVYVGVESAIQKVAPNGVVITLAGSVGSGCGSADGTGSDAQFCFPNGLAVDSAGNVYVADGGNTIRKVTPAGEVTTLAGLAGTYGSADGIGGNSRFASPNGVAVDSSGNLYVADDLNSTIRKMTPDGTVTTLAGLAGSFGSGDVDGTGGAAVFDQPRDVAVDVLGNVYAAETGPTIRKITPRGEVTTLAGSYGQYGTADGTGSAAQFEDPWGIAVDLAGNVYVAERLGGDTIRKVTPAGEVTTLAGLAGIQGSDDGVGDSARFLQPMAVAVDSTGTVYVADTGNNTIRKITPDGTVTTLAGLAGSSGNSDGTGTDARFNSPTGVAVDPDGNLFIADDGNRTIRKITPAGTVTTFAGSTGNSGTNDGPGNVARFLGPYRVKTDKGGNVFVLDSSSIRKIDLNGIVSTVASLAGTGNTDGTGSAAQFFRPESIAVDAADSLYVADDINGNIRVGTTNTCADQPVVDSASGPVGQTRQLDTSPQTAVAWQWSLIRQPSASSAKLSATNIRNPTFTPDVPDLYVFRLYATNAAGAICIRTLSLTATPQPPPQLAITPSGGNVILSWPTSATGFTLQSTTNLVSPAGWATVLQSPVVVNGQYTVANPIAGTKQFFRLSQ